MLRLGDIAERLGGELSGDARVAIRQVAALEQAGDDDISFVAAGRYAARLASSRAAAFILSPQLRSRTDRPCIVTDDPYVYFARVSQLLNPAVRPAPGVSPLADVRCDVPASVTVEAGASVARGVTLGEDVIIGAGCHIGEGASIGDGTVLKANVTIYADCVVGRHGIVHSGVVVGADGFGFAREKDGRWVKIPQIGRVIIGDDTEIGANTTIDRGALDDTVIGDGVKLDNQIQIAHNVHIGDLTAIAGCVGIAGSTCIGRRCMIGGQAGIIGHLNIADDVVISAGTLVTKSIRQPGVYTGNVPQQKHEEWVKNFSHLRRLDSLAERLRQLEKQFDNRSPN